MPVEYDFADAVVVVTGAGGALGSAVAREFLAAGATVAAVDVVDPQSDDYALDPQRVDAYQADLTDESDVEGVIDAVVEAHGAVDALCNVAGTWMGGDPVESTDEATFDAMFDVNLRTAFLASKHALPHLKASEAGDADHNDADPAIVSISSRSSLEGGSGDALYRASKAGVRLLTESIAEENRGSVRANAVMPSVIDTPANRDMMPDADHSSWVDPADIADVIAFLCSDGATPTSGAAVPVYGEA